MSGEAVVLSDGLVIIGEHKVRPSDFGLIESLRQRGCDVAFQDVPVSQQPEQGWVVA